MATDLTHQPDLSGAEELAGGIFGDIMAAELATLYAIADRLGLFDHLATCGPATSDEFARRAGIDARYAREWLSAMACRGNVTYDDGEKRFGMTPEQIACLVDRDSPFYLLSMFATYPTTWANVDLLTESFRSGGGVPQARFGEEFWCGFERFTRTAFRNNLVQDWIPAMPDVDARLRAGGSVADVGCGNGQALLFLARGYPNAMMVGYDSYAPAIESANANAAAAGIADRVRFEVHDATRPIPGEYDLVTTFDVVHDMPHPRPALREIRKALTPGGTHFVLEFNFSGDLQRNIKHPLGIGAFGYAASVNYCMTQSLAVGGEGIGTCMGEEKMRELATEAGFGQFRRIDFPANPFNLFYELRV